MQEFWLAIFQEHIIFIAIIKWWVRGKIVHMGNILNYAAKKSKPLIIAGFHKGMKTSILR